jgi:hypothetical protein
MSNPPTVADTTAAHALDAIAHAKSKFQVDLDFSLESVERLERVLEQIQGTIPKGFIGKIFGGAMQGPIASMSKMYGAYLGEVLRKHAGGEWVVTDAGVTLTKADASVCPSAKVYKRLTNGAEDNVAVYFKVLLDEYWPRG